MALAAYLYSWSKFGREAEYVVALYLKSIGWDVRLSPASRGPADIIATYESSKWFIQVKASSGIPRLKGYEVKRLQELAKGTEGSLLSQRSSRFPAAFQQATTLYSSICLTAGRLLTP